MSFWKVTTSKKNDTYELKFRRLLKNLSNTG